MDPATQGCCAEYGYARPGLVEPTLQAGIHVAAARLGALCNRRSGGLRKSGYMLPPLRG